MRPWLTSEVIVSADTNPYAEYSAWESWFCENYDCALPEGETPIFDELSVTQKAYLFNLMGRVADGDEPEVNRLSARADRAERALGTVQFIQEELSSLRMSVGARQLVENQAGVIARALSGSLDEAPAGRGG